MTQKRKQLKNMAVNITMTGMSLMMVLRSKPWQKTKKKKLTKSTREMKSPIQMQEKRALFQQMHWRTAHCNRKRGTRLLINKEDSSDEETEDGQYEKEDEDESMTSEEHKPDNKEKYDTTQDDSEEPDDGP